MGRRVRCTPDHPFVTHEGGRKLAEQLSRRAALEHLDRVGLADIADKLKVMDATAIVMCRDNDLPLVVFNLNNPGDLVRVAPVEGVVVVAHRGDVR